MGAERGAVALAALHPVARDREELLEPGRELLVPRASKPRLKHRHELGVRSAMYKDDEPEAEGPLVLGVEERERPVLLAVGRAGVLLGGRSRRQAGRRADARVRIQDRDPLGVAHRGEDAPGARDDRRWVATLTDALGEERCSLEGLSYPDR